jgi:hypothetical protein
MAQPSLLNREYFFYSLIILLALALRFARLGGAPLNEFEATAALPVLELAGGGQPALGGQPGYVLLTSLLFGLFGSSEFLARFLPALFGLVLVVLPYFWRDLLGKKVALLLAFFLAIDPGLVAISRMAAGYMLALSVALMALTAWRYGRPVLAGSIAALALLSSPTVYFGVGAAVLVWLTLRLPIRVDKAALRSSALAALVVVLLGGTLFFNVPQGLAGAGQALATFFFGTPNFPGSSLNLTLFALLGYSLPALIFGGFGAWRGWRLDETMGKALSLFAAYTFLLVLINPNRQVADLLWVLLPLWVLAAQVASIFLPAPEDEPVAAIGQAALMLLLAAFLVPTLARLADTGFLLVPASDTLLPAISSHGMIALFVLGIAGLATALIALGWSRRAAAQGLVWALALVFVLFLLSASSRFSRLETAAANELWSPGPAAGQLGILRETLADLSFWDQGQPAALPIELRSESAALRWALRDYAQVPSSSALPAVAITTGESQAPAEFAAYRGQSFALSVQRAWEILPPNFFAWLLFRQAPTQSQQLILWANTELFADASLFDQSSPESETP